MIGIAENQLLIFEDILFEEIRVSPVNRSRLPVQETPGYDHLGVWSKLFDNIFAEHCS